MSIFTPLRYIDGYPPIEDHGLIGDGGTAALVCRDGAISWLCAPRFDSPALFCRILDAQRGGAFVITPEEIVEARQYYAGETGVLVTEMRSPTGVVRVTDALVLRSGADLSEDVPANRTELLRSVEVLHGQVRLKVHIDPRGSATAEERATGLRIRCHDRADLDLQLFSSRPLQGLRTVLDLVDGESFRVLLRWGGGAYSHKPLEMEGYLDATLEAWRRWVACLTYNGPQAALVRRSAITLKMLDHFENGALVAAPTSSLPEAIGGGRNWDYRYVWIRDAAFSVYAFHRIGMGREAQTFLGWVLDAVEQDGRPRILYNLDRQQPAPEWVDQGLEGHRRSPPVRWGNAASYQLQHDVYGEILDCAHQWVAGGNSIDHRLWARLRVLVEAARSEWRTPDHGIWEVRTQGRVFTYSAALCQVALDRGARLAQSFGLSGDVLGWQTAAENIRQAILDEAWDPKANSLTEQLGGGGLDASLLALPIRRVIPANHPRMVATTEAVVKRLGAGNGLLYRYLPHESPDGLEGEEGAFLICSFWLVDNLAYQGRLDEAMDLYDSLCSRAGPLGLLPEQIDPPTGMFLGNYPQAFSHVGVISSGYNLSRLSKGMRR